MQTLHIIQTISKIAKIVSKVIFVFCIVGFCMCIVGVLCLVFGVQALQFGDVTLESILQFEKGITTGMLYAAMIAGMVVCAGSAVLAKFAEHYFKRELQDGTPFTLDGARELMRLGILSICIPIGMQIIAQIVQAVAKIETQELQMNGSVAIGATLIVMALLCRCGTELLTEQSEGEADSGESRDEEQTDRPF